MARDIDYKYNFSMYWKFVSKYKFLAFFLVILVFLREGLQLVDNYFIKIIIDKLELFAQGSIVKEALIAVFISLIFWYVGLVLVRIIVTFGRIHILNVLESDTIRDLKNYFFQHLVHLSHNFHTSNKTGSLISRLVRGGSAMEGLTDVFIFNFFPTFFRMLLILITLLVFSLRSAFFMFIIMLVFVIFSYIMQNKQAPYNLAANDQEDIEKAHVSDYFTNIESIKYFGKESYTNKRFAKQVDETRAKKLKAWQFYRFVDIGYSAIITLGLLVLVSISVYEHVQGYISLGDLSFVITTYFSLIPSLFGFTFGLRGFYHSMTDFQSLFAYSKEVNDVKDVESAKKLVVRRGAISFDSVTFAYKERKVIKDFSLDIKPGEKVALVGHSGSGKSTLVKLLYRLYDIQSGIISVDDNDISKVKAQSLRNEMSIVPQECVLFDDTIYNNIAFSNSKATRKEVMQAMKFAQLDKIVKLFPDQYETIVGERGIKLSGGEKQRVSIARAILANKKILVLDEATSALDSRTEFDIQRDLERLMKNRTTIIIAHRLSTIMSADRIVVMDKGKIVQIGNHKTLIKEKGEYRKLWDLQKGGYLGA